MSDDVRVPVTLLAGFLGAGKTTLLNRLVRSGDAGRVAVVVNEFGELGIDGSLVVGADEDVVELRNGCVCCTVRGDLARTLNRLLDRRRGLLRRLRFDRVAIELSGLASPGPVVQTLVLDDGLRERVRLDGIVALASAPDLTRQLAEHPEAAAQLGYADLVLLNHADRATEALLTAAEAAVRGLNRLARVRRCVRGEVPTAELLAIRTDAAETWGLDRAAAGAAACSDADCADPGHGHDPGHGQDFGHHHSQGVGTLAFESAEPLDLHRLKVWLQFVASRRDAELLRLKGILRCAGQPRAVVVQAVYQWLEIGPGELDPPGVSRLVMIGRDLDREALERGWRAVCGRPGPD